MANKCWLIKNRPVWIEKESPPPTSAKNITPQSTGNTENVAITKNNVDQFATRKVWMPIMAKTKTKKTGCQLRQVTTKNDNVVTLMLEVSIKVHH